MSKKSRKFKRAAAVAAERKSALGLKKKEGKVKKEALLKALSEKSVSTITSPINAPGGRKKRRHKKKAANSKSGCEHMAIGHDVNETHSRKQTKDNSAAMGATGKRKKKRKRSGKGRAPSEPPSEDKRPSESVIPVPKSNGIIEASGKLRKRRKRRASLEVANAPELLMSVNPSKKVRLEEALSESEPELINADWGLADDSSEKGSGNSKADLDTSEDDVDEEPPHSDGDTDGSDINEKLKDSQCVDSSKNSDVGNPGKEESGGNQQDVEIQACRPVKKKFSLLDRAAILKEMQDRIADSAFITHIFGYVNFNQLAYRSYDHPDLVYE
ncbi:unnamed protein product [Hydatigera taeniaeformis]|uniref:Transcription termination factor 1 n=1 Tax=Hydatigena taeniaeformis TaxID=6205 RepID=A0A0R3WV26_HYDTA|nr:unnamed protein product [Hydatigera taeniaeformis]